ncbi:MAG TPA: carboxypeptidase regulatory-like domain-containing protein [Solirubrobacter sp.]|nr:carboxypeptidase regulatory-like domain-containing protein [Solirubrobacter sp.]
MAFRTLRRSESGFALVEVIVSAAVLAIVAMAVLSGIDAATGSSAREKARAVAANLGEQEQERLRSLTVEELTDIAGKGAEGVTRDPAPDVDGVKYKVNSRAEWITDDQGGTPACGNSSKNSEYFHVTTTVTSEIVGKNVPPIVIDSLVAPSTEYSSTHGILGVKVVDRNGDPVQGVVVEIANSDPPYSPPQQSTDPKGCALFRQVPIGTYTITLTAGGYVGTELEQPTTDTQKVSPGVVVFKTMEFDRSTQARVTVQTNRPGNINQKVNSTAAAISVTHPRRTGKVKTYDTAGANPYVATPLYPFKSGAYSFFTGRCGYESPDAVTGDPNYFSTYSGSLVADLTKPQPQDVTVLQPPLRLRVDKDSSGSAFAATNYEAYAKLQSREDDDCREARIELALKTWPSTWTPMPTEGTANWLVQKTSDTNAFDPGLPYGTYDVCILDKRSTTRQIAQFTYVNTEPGGAKSTTTIVKANWKAGTRTTQCPA